MTLAPKKVSESRTYRSEIVLTNHMNGTNRLFGGQLAQWIDIVGGVAGRRHSGHNVTTAVIDRLEFMGPAHLDDMLLLIGQVTYTGRTSMEVRIDTYIENIANSNERKLINRCYMVLVALDENENPVEVPPLACETPEEAHEREEGKKRTALRKSSRYLYTRD